MRNLLFAAAAAGLALAGCTPQEERVNPSGNYPDVRTGNTAASGTLSFENIDWPPPQIGGQGRAVPMASPLASVYDRDGKFVTYVRSTETSLAPGRYLVRFEDRDENAGPFWVTIEPDRTTAVDAKAVEHADGQRLNAK